MSQMTVSTPSQMEFMRLVFRAQQPSAFARSKNAPWTAEVLRTYEATVTMA